MDEQRFDRWTRSLSASTSRRETLRRLGLGGLAAAFAGLLGRSQAAQAHHCDFYGCGCATGAYHPCADGLVCCPSSPGTPGGAGTCINDFECDDTSPPSDTCGYIGCACATGTFQPCDDGLICCPNSPGLPGGSGVCAPPEQCGSYCTPAGDSCPSYCNWADNCPDCCSGFCGTFGSCA